MSANTVDVQLRSGLERRTIRAGTLVEIAGKTSVVADVHPIESHQPHMYRLTLTNRVSTPSTQAR